MTICLRCGTEFPGGQDCPVCEAEARSKAFHKTGETERKEKVITIWLNQEEQVILETAKKVLEQEKDGTAFKQLAILGFKTISSSETSYLLGVVFANKRRNKRLGIPDFETL